ncbi:MAG: FAD:protein FMN transferase, partial [Planctomycetota bacterium]
DRAARQAYRANLAASSALLATDPLAARRRLEDTPEEERGWEWSYLSSLLDGKLIEFGGETLESQFGDVEVFASGARVVSQISPSELGIFDTRTGERVRTLEAQRPVVTIGIADDGRLLAVGRDDGGVDVIEPTKGDEWANWLPAREGSPIVRVDVAPGGEYVAVARGEEILQVTRDEARVLLTAENPIPRRNDVEYSEDGQFLAALATGAHLRKFQIFEVSTLEKRLPEPFHVAGAMDVALSPDGNRFAIAHEQRRVTVGHVADPSHQEEFFAHNKVVRSVEFREDGSLLTVSDDQSARVWDLEEGELVRHIPLENLRDAAFAADDTLVSSCPTGLALWRVSEPRAITLTGFEDYLYDLAFSPSGRVLASTSLVQGVCVWDVHTGRALHEHAGSTGPIGVSFDVPGEQVLQPGFPADVLYDWASGQESQSPSPLPFRVAHQGDRVHVDDRFRSKALSQEFEIWRVEHSENGARLLNAAAPDGWVTVTDELFTLLLASQRISELTGGAFDVTFGSA